MATRVRLYYTERNTNKWELLANKLLIVEDIEAYLNTKTFLDITNFQYIKNELELAINVQITQTYSQPKTSTNFKYVAIQNENELVHYYFVKKAYWRSKDCVRFELVMDVLNSFQEGQDYTFKPNTKITREHKDRFIVADPEKVLDFETQLLEYDGTIEGEHIEIYATQDPDTLIAAGECITGDQDFCRIKLDSAFDIDEIKAYIESDLSLTDFIFKYDLNNYYTYSVNSVSITILSANYYRNIDYISEGINPILENVDRRTILNPAAILDQDWFLLYRNQNDPSESQASSLINPVECYLIPNNEVAVIGTAVVGGRIIPSSLNSNYTYYIIIADGSALTLTFNTGKIIAATNIESPVRKIISIRKNSDNTITLTSLYGYSSSGYGSTAVNYEGTWTCESFVISSMPQEYMYTDEELPVASIFQDYYAEVNDLPSGYFTNTENVENVNGIKDLDRTQSKNIKLIKLPYCPYNFTITNNKIDVSSDENWDIVVVDNILALKLAKLNTKLTANFNSITNPFDNLKTTIPNNASINNLRVTNINIESKLFHSDFRRDTFVYDSFSWVVPLERLSIDYYITQTRSFNIKFDMTSTINSKFMFTFTPFASGKALENFPNVLPIARNNEEVLYNVPYVNYIRTGFNYEVKSKNLSIASNIAGVGLSMASVGASLLFPSSPLKVAGVVASLVSVAMSVKSTISSALSNENSIRQKIDQLKNQAASVAGSDDVDLMSVYSGNRLKWILYEPNQLMKNLLFDLFFYAGYNSGRMGLPNHNTRINFDYLECDASFESVSSIPEECLNELISCFKNGVTYLHKTNRSSDKWDFEQKYENWERSIIGE